MDELRANAKYFREFRDASIMSFTETWLQDRHDDSHIEINGFKILRGDRTCESGKKRGGGIFKREKPRTIKVKKWTAEATERLQDAFDDTDWEMFINNANDLNELTDTVSEYINFCSDMQCLSQLKRLKFHFQKHGNNHLLFLFQKAVLLKYMNDLRPVALTSVVGKICEKIVLKCLKPIVTTHTDPMQFAYRSARSTEDAIVVKLERLYRHLDKTKVGNSARVMYYDFSSAFNTIQPHLLVDKLWWGGNVTEGDKGRIYRVVRRVERMSDFCQQSVDSVYCENLDRLFGMVLRDESHPVNSDLGSLRSARSGRLKKCTVIPIFAVAKSKQRDDPALYQEVVNEFFPGGSVGTLASDSRNIIELVRSSYDKITSEIQLVDTVTAPIHVTYSAYCDGETLTPNLQNCSNIRLGNVIKFKLDVSVDECTANPISFSVKPLGFEENLEVVIITNCECECTKSVTPDSELCSNGNGSLVCGICECNEGRYGEVCECDDTGSNETETLADSLPCQTSNSSLVCSGQGSCICGKCVCNKRQNPLEKITGKFCNCDNFSCRRDSADLICGGPSKGTCICGQCECKPGYSGPDCSCPTSIENCLASTGKECNDAGHCECGVCMCNATLVYDGPTCEDCDTCPAKCDRNRDCVQCLAYGTGISEEKCQECPQRIILVEEEELIVNGTDPCTYKDELGCLFSFNFVMNGTMEVILVQKITSCPEGIDALWLAIGIIIGILLVGLALLLAWKIATFIYDKREYAKFLKELENARTDANINPLFKSSTTTYKNPTYGK
ncbi:integrin beta-1-like [Antedon mediterranea]|uniref:integrin beta-1-like n=1 Tax=Antedon mediterranea TaxID=105859 RepID=UPI003AF6F148